MYPGGNRRLPHKAPLGKPPQNHVPLPVHAGFYHFRACKSIVRGRAWGKGNGMEKFFCRSDNSLRFP